MKDIETYQASDYAGLIAGNLHFYYGYEETLCPVHGKNVQCEDVHDCYDSEWTFMVRKDREEIFRIPTSEIDNQAEFREANPIDYLIAGIGIYLKTLEVLK